MGIAVSDTVKYVESRSMLTNQTAATTLRDHLLCTVLVAQEYAPGIDTHNTVEVLDRRYNA